MRVGDTAVALLKAGAETDKKDVDGFLAMELAPDSKVWKCLNLSGICWANLCRSESLYSKVQSVRE